jgi:hypothetical protein
MASIVMRKTVLLSGRITVDRANGVEVTLCLSTNINSVVLLIAQRLTMVNCAARVTHIREQGRCTRDVVTLYQKTIPVCNKHLLMLREWNKAGVLKERLKSCWGIG